MSLKAFHIVFITLSSLLSMGLGLWGLNGYLTTGERDPLLLGIAGFLALLLLIPYFRWFRRKMKKLDSTLVGALILLSTFFSGHPALACAVCYGDPNSSLIRSMKMGMLSLAGLIYLLLGAMIVVAVSWIKRSKRLRGISP